LDIAALSVVLANHQLKTQASIAVMNHAKNFAELQGQQLVDLLKSSQISPTPSHPSLGTQIDVKV